MLVKHKSKISPFTLSPSLQASEKVWDACTESIVGETYFLSFSSRINDSSIIKNKDETIIKTCILIRERVHVAAGRDDINTTCSTQRAGIIRVEASFWKLAAESTHLHSTLLQLCPGNITNRMSVPLVLTPANPKHTAPPTSFYLSLIGPQPSHI